ncbi:MAG: hypothetical protein ABF990_12405 [Acetobacter sp.]|uniref:hypothetical protein n=1 Tax=Acetobacter sp. TaxID=440 RepID=UPI0039E9FE25
MTDIPDTPPASPRLTEKAQAARAERQARQAAALRANLHRRKEQARTRQDSTPDTARPETDTPPGENKTCP